MGEDHAAELSSSSSAGWLDAPYQCASTGVSKEKEERK